MDLKWKLWIDTGGTFTDCLAMNPAGKLLRTKILSSARLKGKIQRNNSDELQIETGWTITHDIFAGYSIEIEGISDTYIIESTNLSKGKIFIDQDPGDVAGLGFEIYSGEEAPVLAARLVTNTAMHEDLPLMEMRLGSTKGTNALLEGKGTKPVLITTKGHRDLLAIGTQQRPDIFSLNIVKQAPLYVKVIEIDERVLTNGRVLAALQEKKLESIRTEVGSGTEVFAIALLNSYINDSHELVIADYLRRLGYSHISVSSNLVREIGVLARAQTTVVNAYLSKIIESYLNNVSSKIPQGNLKVMTSAGGLNSSELFLPKDSLFSGPAGGVVGCASIAHVHGVDSILSFDMGGTSTDVSRYDNGFDYRFITEINQITINSPSIAIETVAAGGGSVCGFDGYKLTVGPESAGASPGPACYGNGGPLAITDVNFLLGRVHSSNFSIPLDLNASKEALSKISATMGDSGDDEEILQGYLKIANEKMAEAIRKISIGKGYDTAHYTLLAFGGAGGQHACSVANLLSIQKILIPFEAGLLSAYGMGCAQIERFVTRPILKPLHDIEDQLSTVFDELSKEAEKLLMDEGIEKDDMHVQHQLVYLRYKGQETALEIEYENKPLLEEFRNAYTKRYGHWLEKDVVEVASVKLVAATRMDAINRIDPPENKYDPAVEQKVKCFTGSEWQDIPSFDWEDLTSGASVNGPALVLSSNSTVYLESDWELVIQGNKDALLTRTGKSIKEDKNLSESAELELFINRFKSIADDMGAILQRTSFSVNVKDRMDFSCAILDKNGYLVANAPHIPVHLGSLGVCVREVVKRLDMEQGDVVITNHPAFGGSHLPDVTLIAPVYFEGDLVGFVVNRAHHAEIGGKTPGSMPANAKNLSEEGVVIAPTFLVKAHRPLWDQIRHLLINSAFPSRAVDENLADLNGALASIQNGVEGVQLLCSKFGREKVETYMKKMLDYSAKSLMNTFKKLQNSHWSAKESLDDGSIISVEISKTENEILFDFEGTSPVHPGNLNATLAIVNSAVIYVLRLMLEEPLPLNEGLMKYVRISVPECMLNPLFEEDPKRSPAVVGGNTETSQRLVDTLLKALKLAACSQGTMNNLIFGNNKFGFYETIGGGAGAGDGFNGADAVHQHMTNTKITDPEILEFRYPVLLKKMSIRKNSGGKGKWNGGNGIVRELQFEEDVILTLLSQHRNEAPYGMNGGSPGESGRQTVIRKSGEKIELKGIDTIELKKGDCIRIETPGGGGYGNSA